MSAAPFVAKFRLPLYRTRVTVLFGDDLRACHGLLHKSLQASELDSDACALTYPIVMGRTAITFNTRYLGVIVNAIGHEAFHMTMNVMDYVGIRHAPESEEAFAYTQGEIVNQLTAAYAKYLAAAKRTTKEAQ